MWHVFVSCMNSFFPQCGMEWLKLYEIIFGFELYLKFREVVERSYMQL